MKPLVHTLRVPSADPKTRTPKGSAICGPDRVRTSSSRGFYMLLIRRYRPASGMKNTTPTRPSANSVTIPKQKPPSRSNIGVPTFEHDDAGRPSKCDPPPRFVHCEFKSNRKQIVDQDLRVAIE